MVVLCQKDVDVLQRVRTVPQGGFAQSVDIARKVLLTGRVVLHEAVALGIALHAIGLGYATFFLKFGYGLVEVGYGQVELGNKAQGTLGHAGLGGLHLDGGRPLATAWRKPCLLCHTRHGGRVREHANHVVGPCLLLYEPACGQKPPWPKDLLLLHELGIEQYHVLLALGLGEVLRCRIPPCLIKGLLLQGIKG